METVKDFISLFLLFGGCYLCIRMIPGGIKDILHRYKLREEYLKTHGE